MSGCVDCDKKHLTPSGEWLCWSPEMGCYVPIDLLKNELPSTKPILCPRRTDNTEEVGE